MRGGLVLHTIIIPAALSLPLLRGAAVGRAPTIFQNDWCCTRISNFSKSPIFSITSNLFSIFLTKNVTGVAFCDIWCDICDIARSLKKTFHNPFSCDNSGVLRKCPIWDIFPRSPFVSMKEISRLFRNLENADLHAREEENGLWIMECSGQDQP